MLRSKSWFYTQKLPWKALCCATTYFLFSRITFYTFLNLFNIFKILNPFCSFCLRYKKSLTNCYPCSNDALRNMWPVSTYFKCLSSLLGFGQFFCLEFHCTFIFFNIFQTKYKKCFFCWQISSLISIKYLVISSKKNLTQLLHWTWFLLQWYQIFSWYSILVPFSLKMNSCSI